MNQAQPKLINSKKNRRRRWHSLRFVRMKSKEAICFPFNSFLRYYKQAAAQKHFKQQDKKERKGERKKRKRGRRKKKEENLKKFSTKVT